MIMPSPLLLLLKLDLVLPIHTVVNTISPGRWYNRDAVCPRTRHFSQTLIALEQPLGLSAIAELLVLSQ